MTDQMTYRQTIRNEKEEIDLVHKTHIGCQIDQCQKHQTDQERRVERRVRCLRYG